MHLTRSALAFSVVALFTLAGCGGGGSSDSPPAAPAITTPPVTPPATTDTTPPTVSGRSPLTSATGVGEASAISATFSEAITGATTATMTVGSGGTPLVGTVATNPSNLTATFTPTGGLYCNATHTVALTAGIKDTAGNALAPTSWTFMTKPFANPWTFIGNAAATVGLNRPLPVPLPPTAVPETGSASDPHMVALGTKVYAIWAQKNAGGFEQVYVSVYDTASATPAWAVVDAGNVGILNRTVGQPGLNPQLAVLGTKLYAIWTEFNNPPPPPVTTPPTPARPRTNQIRVAEYNESPPSWTFIGNASVDDGINRDVTRSAGSPQFMAFNNRLYAIWTELNGDTTPTSKVRVAVYNGTSAWTPVDVVAASGLNRHPSGDAFDPSLGVFEGKLYATWNEIVGSEEPPPAGINARHLLRVSVYNGTNAWEPADGNPVAGLNRSPIFNANYSRLAVFGGKLHLIWQEDYLNIDPPATPQGFKIRAAVYNNLLGAAARWDLVDGNLPIGLNKTLASSGTRPQVAVYGDKLYVTWQEGPAVGGTGPTQIRLKGYNGTSWSFADGDLAAGINRLATNSAATPQLTVLGTKLFSTWSESNGAAPTPINQIRVAAAGCP